MNKGKIKRRNRIISPGVRIFSVVNTIILVTLGLLCLIPFWYEVCVSLSSNRAVIANEVTYDPAIPLLGI